jgi:hypothetical protein
MENKSIHMMDEALASVDQVEAVCLGGSRGLGTANTNSDYDYVIFHKGEKRVTASKIAKVISPILDEAEFLDTGDLKFGNIKNSKIEIFHKSIDLIENEIKRAKEGKFNISIRPLFPHGFISSSILSHVAYLEICNERNECITNLKKMITPMPEVLKKSLIKYFHNQAAISIIHLKKINKETENFYATTICSAYFFYLNVVILAKNNIYPLIEKSGSDLVYTKCNGPNNYKSRVDEVFILVSQSNYKKVIEQLESIHIEVTKLLNS